MTVEIRGEMAVLGDHQIGKVWCTGPALMVGYFRDPEATAACMVDGWLDTGDMGYHGPMAICSSSAAPRT
jgi:fatty-acyl-CoA synthase